MSEKSVPEHDKPFYLAIVASAITVLTIIVAAVGAYLGNDALRSTGLEALKFTFPLTTAAWTYYFQK